MSNSRGFTIMTMTKLLGISLALVMLVGSAPLGFSEPLKDQFEQVGVDTTPADRGIIEYEPTTHQVILSWDFEDYTGTCYMTSIVDLYDEFGNNDDRYHFVGTDLTPIENYQWPEGNTGYYNNDVSCTGNFDFYLQDLDLDITTSYEKIQITTFFFQDGNLFDYLYILKFSYSETIDLLPFSCPAGTDIEEYIYDVNDSELQEYYNDECYNSTEVFEGVIPLVFPSQQYCGEELSYYNIINGTTSDDILNGTRGADLIFGLDGNDTIYGNGGNDCIFGGDGFDFIKGGKGVDTIDGGDGDDICKINSKSEAVNCEIIRVRN